MTCLWLDVSVIRQVVGDLYQSLLTLYDPQIPTALGSACLRLLESEPGLWVICCIWFRDSNLSNCTGCGRQSLGEAAVFGRRLSLDGDCLWSS